MGSSLYQSKAEKQICLLVAMGAHNSRVLTHMKHVKGAP
jgi:hypothetical protein